MKTFGYARISRDEDGKQESIETQSKLIMSYAKDNDIKIENIIQDNNVSGYTFNRPGLNKIKQLINEREIDVLIAKDLSRIGRNNLETLIFLDLLEESNVRLILITDYFDSFDKNDSRDLLDFKSLYNQFYVKDTSRKIKSNMKQKQRDGLVMHPTYGYQKIPGSKNKLIIDEDAAEVVKLIFELCIEGYGSKLISRELNKRGIETPSMYRNRTRGTSCNANWTHGNLWIYTTVYRILKNDAYIGTLRCGKTAKKKIKGKTQMVPEEDHIVHLNYMEPIIDKETFYMVQRLLENRATNNVKAKNLKVHKYAGLIKCKECGKGFVARYNKSKNVTSISYICAVYHRYGKEHCSSHRIKEQELDDIIYSELENQIEKHQEMFESIDISINKSIDLKDSQIQKIEQLEVEIFRMKEEIKSYAKQLARELISEELYNELTEENRKLMKNKISRLEEVKNYSANLKVKKREVISSIEILKEILDKKELTNTDLVMLIEKIVIEEVEEKELLIDVVWRN